MTEDLSPYLADFGVAVTGPSTSSGLGILDQPDRIFNDAVGIISTEYLLTIRTSDFPQLKDGDSMTVAGVAYTVREAQKIDDGSFSKVLLSKT